MARLNPQIVTTADTSHRACHVSNQEPAIYLADVLRSLVCMQVEHYKDIRLMTGGYKSDASILHKSAERVALINAWLDATDEEGEPYSNVAL
jgi:hypothetical protein